MKKLCLMFLGLYAISLHAQFGRQYGNAQYELIGVEVFSEPNYGGTRANLTAGGEQRVAFNIRSMKIPNGYMVYSKIANECGYPTIYNGPVNLPNILTQCGLMSDIVILRRPSSKSILLSLGGITTTVHNGDCQRMYGNINYTVTYRGLTINGLTNLIQWERGPVRQVGNNASGGVNTRASGNIASSTFIIDELVQSECQINITTNLGSAHKKCDLCSGFTWESKMAQPQFFSLNLSDAITRSRQSSIVLGPYRSSDNLHNISSFFSVARQ